MPLNCELRTDVPTCAIRLSDIMHKTTEKDLVTDIVSVRFAPMMSKTMCHIRKISVRENKADTNSNPLFSVCGTKPDNPACMIGC